MSKMIYMYSEALCSSLRSTSALCLVLLDLLRILPLRFHIISSAPKFPVSALIPQFKVLLINHQTALPFQSALQTRIHPLSPVFPPAYAHGRVDLLLRFLSSSNFTAFANFLLSLVFFLYRISFCDSFGKIRYGSCYSSLYTLKGRLSVILFTSFIDLPLLFIVQLADRTFF